MGGRLLSGPRAVNQGGNGHGVVQGRLPSIHRIRTEAMSDARNMNSLPSWSVMISQ